METIVWIFFVWPNACSLPSCSFSCAFGAVSLFYSTTFQCLLRKGRRLRSLRDGSSWCQLWGLPTLASRKHSQRFFKFSRGKVQRLLCLSHALLSTPQDCHDTSFYLGIPKLLESGNSGCLISQCGLEGVLTQSDLICSYVWPRLQLPHNHILFYYFGIMAAWTL